MVIRRLIVRATFNAAAEFFDDPELGFWDRCGVRTVEQLDLKPGDRVVDACCGTGASAIPAAERVGPQGQVLGIDLAEALLVLARAKARAKTEERGTGAEERGTGRAEFRVGDMTALPVEDGSVDAVICVFGLYYAPDPVAALAQLFRKIRGGGVLAVTTWGERSLEPGHSILMRCIAAERSDLAPASGRPDPGRSTVDDIVATFVRAGAGRPSVTAETIRQPVTADGFWTIVLGSGYRVAIDAMGPSAAERVRGSVEHALTLGGVRELVSDVLYARARKR